MSLRYFKRPMKRLMGRTSTLNEIAQGRLALCLACRSRDYRSLAPADTQRPESDDPPKCRSPDDKNRERLSPVPCSDRKQASAGTTSQTARLFPLSWQATSVTPRPSCVTRGADGSMVLSSKTGDS